MNKTDSSEAVASATILPDGSAFSVASLPLPADHWLYAPRCTEWDAVRDTSADVPHPILTHAQREAVIAAVRYAIRGATMCGNESDFDPDALVQNAVYALCGPYGFDAPAPQADAAPSDQSADVRNALVSLECTRQWLAGGCDPKAAVAEIEGIMRMLQGEPGGAAIAAGGAQEPIGYVPDYVLREIAQGRKISSVHISLERSVDCDSPIYAAPLPRVAETVTSVMRLPNGWSIERRHYPEIPEEDQAEDVTYTLRGPNRDQAIYYDISSCNGVAHRFLRDMCKAALSEPRTAAPITLTVEQSNAIDAVCAMLTPRQTVDLGAHIEAIRSIQWRAASSAADSQDDIPAPLTDGQRSHALSYYMSLPHDWESGEALIQKVSADAYVNGFQAGKACAADSQDERASVDVDVAKAVWKDWLAKRGTDIDFKSHKPAIELVRYAMERAASAPAHASAAGAPTQVATTHSTTTIEGKES